ncbi:MAG: hypothetical protein EOM66_00865, partial [Clostridia bacterium]|nr:hypothetical protein [Clostridia bacterium]
MLALFWGVAWGAGAFFCLRAACFRMLRGLPGAVLLMAANLALIGACLGACALLFPHQLAWAGSGLAGALILGAALQSIGRLPASGEK